MCLTCLLGGRGQPRVREPDWPAPACASPASKQVAGIFHPFRGKHALPILRLKRWGIPKLPAGQLRCRRAPHPQKEKTATMSTAILRARVLSSTAVSLGGPAGWPTGRLSFFSLSLLLPSLWGRFLRGWPEHGLQEDGVLQLRHSAAEWNLPLSRFPLLQLSPEPQPPLIW